MTDESVRDYLKYFAADDATSAVTRAIQNKVDFYHMDPKTRSDYVTFKDMPEGERDEGRKDRIAIGRSQGAELKNRELAKKFRDRGVSIEIIAEESGLISEEIKSL